MTSFKDIRLTTASIEELIDFILHQVLEFSLKLLVCIIVYWVGKRLIKYLNRGIDRIMNKRKFDPSITSFFRSFINIILTAVLLLIVVNILGINSSSFVALFASIGVALGMALSGTLQNFAGGVMILLFRPYRVGDYIEAQGQGGTVTAIQIFNTVILTADNRTIYIPNGGLSSNTIINYNRQKNRRVEWVVGVSYGTNFDQAKKILQDLLAKDKRIIHTPEPSIVLQTLNNSSIDIQIRAWVSRPDYWDVYYDINEQIYKTLNEQGIDIPFPQMTVHLAEPRAAKSSIE
ncbi:MAG: Small-conductance mechanosensitive channel [Candidatus Ordinivivax streblomastigis]|uniref:Small-conductance mechanosensitive channel n=1 Tax=Candidatus Ordinivivax streblomastigis TaxID=2540710 RepID=A0A5M8P0S5_9BACT|nr:MAG: Small-conductance mechanosensitive channel [Candidatus Ordinivivax streblomastigis]